MSNFYDIREFACKHFYVWEEGEDFFWLKSEWHKFEPHLNNVKEKEDFILTLADIYEKFCSESYFAKVTEEDVKKYSWIIEDPNPSVVDPVIIQRIEQFYNTTLEILLKVYIRPEEILREIVSIAISFEVPHPDGYEYIFNLFKDIYKEPDIDSIIF